MAKNYNIEYTNIAGDSFKVTFGVFAFNPTIVEMDGYAVLRRDGASSVFDPIRATVCDVVVVASKENDFSEFVTAPENLIFCTVEKNNIPIFAGTINPDNIFQDFVNDTWEVTLSAKCGLARLKNLEFEPIFKTALGATFAGGGINIPQESLLMFACLMRASIFDIRKVAYFDDLNLFNLNNNRIDLRSYQNTNGRFISFEEVLIDIINKRNCIVFLDTINGELMWVVQSNVKRANTPSTTGIIYELQSNQTWSNVGTVSLPTATIYSDTLAPNLDAPIHAKKDQSYDFLPTVQGLRAEMEWVGLRDINTFVYRNEDYTLNETSPPASFQNGKLILPATPNDFANPNILSATQLNFINLPNTAEGYKLRNEFKAKVTSTGASTFPLRFWVIFEIRATTSTPFQNFWLARNGDEVEWVESQTFFRSDDYFQRVLSLQEVAFDLEIDLPPLPSAFGLLVNVYRPRVPQIAPHIFFNSQITFNPFVLTYNGSEFGKGVFYDAQRTSFQSSFVPEVTKVKNANFTPPFFVNNLVNQAGLPQTSFSRGSVSYPDILEQFVKERISLAQVVRKRFNGSVLGFVPYFSAVQYADIQGLFSAVKWKYDTDRNEVFLEAHELTSGLVGVNYEKSFIFENEINVKIRS